MNNRLYVGNLSYDVTSDSLRACFAQFGEISDLHVAMDRETGRARGFAFVTMGTEPVSEGSSDFCCRPISTVVLTLETSPQGRSSRNRWPYLTCPALTRRVTIDRP